MKNNTLFTRRRTYGVRANITITVPTLDRPTAEGFREPATAIADNATLGQRQYADLVRHFGVPELQSQDGWLRIGDGDAQQWEGDAEPLDDATAAPEGDFPESIDSPAYKTYETDNAAPALLLAVNMDLTEAEADSVIRRRARSSDTIYSGDTHTAWQLLKDATAVLLASPADAVTDPALADFPEMASPVCHAARWIRDFRTRADRERRERGFTTQ